MATATEILVGDLVAGTRVDTGNQIAVKATVRAIRVLKGGMQPGGATPVAWQYPPGPLDTPAVSGNVAPMRGMWFLRQGASGVEVLPSGQGGGALGGYVLELPQAPLPGDLYYGPDQPLEERMARELAGGIVDLAATHSAELTSLSQPPARGTLPGVSTRGRFRALTMALAELKPQATFKRLPVLQRTGGCQFEDAWAAGTHRRQGLDCVNRVGARPSAPSHGLHG